MHPTGLLSRRGARDPDRRRGLLRRPQRERTPSGSGTTPPSCEMAAPQPLVHTGFAVHGEGRAVAVGQHPPPRVRPSRDARAGSVVLPVHAAAGRVGRSRPGARTASGRPAHAAPAGYLSLLDMAPTSHGSQTPGSPGRFTRASREGGNIVHYILPNDSPMAYPLVPLRAGGNRWGFGVPPSSISSWTATS